MARLLAIYSDNNQKFDFDKNKDWLANCKAKSNSPGINEEIYQLLDNKLTIQVIHQGSDLNVINNQDYFLFIDGSPHVEGKKQTIEQWLNKIVQYGPEKFADLIDGGWNALFVNKKNNEIMAFRDRMGLRPIYYHKQGSTFAVASSAGSLVKANITKFGPNERVVTRYATSHYRVVYGSEESFFKDVQLLPPSSIITYQNNKVSKSTYWEFDPSQNHIKKTDAEYEELYRSTLETMMSEYAEAHSNEELYIALSGGIDSGTIVGLMHQVLKKKVPAISMTYSESTSFDESHLIDCSVRDHVSKWTDVKLNSQVLLDDLEGLYDRFDIPLATISIYGYDYLYREAANIGMKKIFTGSGGDYIQAGNYAYFLYHLAQLKKDNSAIYKDELNAWIKNHSTELYPKTEKTLLDFIEDNINLDTAGEITAKQMPFNPELVANQNLLTNRVLTGDIVSSLGDYNRTFIAQEHFYEAVPPGTEAEDMIDWSWNTSMISPFFSKKVVEFGWTLPDEQKIKNGVNKVLARRALRGICSDEILDRVDKSGFNAPFDLWSRGPLNDFVMDTFNSQSFKNRSFYDISVFNKMLDEHMKEKRNHMMLLWQALNLELWLKAWEK